MKVLNLIMGGILASLIVWSGIAISLINPDSKCQTIGDVMCRMNVMANEMVLPTFVLFMTLMFGVLPFGLSLTSGKNKCIKQQSNGIDKQ